MTAPVRMPFAARLRLMRNKRYEDWWHIVFGGPLGMGTAYPPMTLVEVKGLLEDRAMVEIEATVRLP